MLKQKREVMETKTKGRNDLQNIQFDPAVIQRIDNACSLLLNSLDNSNAIETITGQLRTLSSDKLQEILDAHNKEKTGGDTTWKLKNSCFIFFGPDGEALLDAVEKLESVKEGVESAYDHAVATLEMVDETRDWLQQWKHWLLSAPKDVSCDTN